jgi:C1A family cysteine protease
MRTFAAAILATVSSAKVFTEMDFKFMNYVNKFGKSYKDVEEFNLRAALFAKWDAEIAVHQMNETTSTHDHNFLSDWTAAEKTSLLGLKNMVIEENPAPEFDNGLHAVGIPTSINWCTSSACNPIQNQGQCGSCWAFAAVATMESAHKIQHGSLYKLSEQNEVSCSSSFGNNGCNGGLAQYAWNYAKTNKLESESNYPYSSGTGITGTCKYNSSLGIGGVTSWANCGTSSSAIETCIATAPNAIAVEADTSYFQSYSSGIMTNAAACGTNLDHAIVAVGYNLTSNYFIVRNSWGTSWGLSGYANLSIIAYPGMCGMNKQVQNVTTTA